VLLTLRGVAFDEGLAFRVREQLGARPDLTEKKMFGGLAFMTSGNMLVGVIGDDLIARVGRDAMDDALAQPGTRLFDITGRPMSGWVVVAGDAVAEDDSLLSWIQRADRFVETLPPK
jgi:TfoX/Sxy family transcriptional regulator of competence genes